MKLEENLDSENKAFSVPDLLTCSLFKDADKHMQFYYTKNSANLNIYFLE